MEGKGVLFKRFADIDVFDIELATEDPKEIIRTCQLLEPTFGGINLEDIKAPECFEIEEELKRTHEDSGLPRRSARHGDHLRRGAAERAGDRRQEASRTCKIVFNGAGASAISCANHYIQLGVRLENILMCDTKGVIYEGRTEGMNKYKEQFAAETEARTLADAMTGADVFFGLSSGQLRRRRRCCWRWRRKPDRLRAGQSRSGDHLRPGRGDAPRRHHRHRPLRLSRTR